MRPLDPTDKPGRRLVLAEDQSEYEPLPCRIDGDQVHTRWQLTAEERQALLEGACIDLTLLTFGMPLQPILLSVQGTVEPTSQVELPR